jgi:tetratricopeptide (TPR) repeat protein
VEIEIINFLYLHDKGYESQNNSKHEVETSTLFPAIEKDIRKNGLSNYSIKFEKVLTGNLEYSGPGIVKSDFNAHDDDAYDLSIWGLVKPITWPSHYDLDLIIFFNSNLLLRSDIKIRNNNIVLWDGHKCNLSKDVLSIIPGIFAEVISHQNGKKLNDEISSQISERLKILPRPVIEKTMNAVRHWSSQTNEMANNSVGSVDFVYESGTNHKVYIDQQTYDLLQRFLTTNKSYNWYIDQGGVLMPEISIVLGSRDREVSTSDFEMSFAEPRTPAQLQVGIVPFKNNSTSSDHSWVGFGLEYLLSNKFSQIPSYKLANHNVVLRYINSDSASVFINGEEWTLDYTIGGSYATDNGHIEVDLSYTKPFTGTQLASDHYSAEYSDFFDIVDNAAKKFLRVTGITLSENEEKLFNREVTSSMQAFENFCMGYIENAKSNRDEASVISYFLAAINDDPEFWGAYYNLGTTFYNREEYTSALAQFNYIIDHFPSFELAYFGRGLTYFQTNYFNKAKDDFEIYSKYKPNDFRVYYYLGRILSHQKKYADARAYLSKAIELNPNYGKNYYELGNVYFTMNRFRPAITQYQRALTLEPEHLETHLHLGESYYRMHNFSGAINEFKRVLEAEPDNADANFMMGVTVYKQALLDEYIDGFLEMYGLLNKEEIASNKIKHEAEQRRVYNEMTRRFYRAQLSRTNFYEATFNLALTYQERGIADSALIYYNKTLQLNPNLTKARIVLAKYYENQDQTDLALKEYKVVVRNDPDYFIGYSNLGPLYDDMDIVAVVVNELETEVRADPHNIDSSLSLAGIYHAQGYNGKAATLYRKVLSLNPEHKKAKVMLARINGHE